MTYLRKANILRNSRRLWICCCVCVYNADTLLLLRIPYILFPSFFFVLFVPLSRGNLHPLLIRGHKLDRVKTFTQLAEWLHLASQHVFARKSDPGSKIKFFEIAARQPVCERYRATSRLMLSMRQTGGDDKTLQRGIRLRAGRCLPHCSVLGKQTVYN